MGGDCVEYDESIDRLVAECLSLLVLWSIWNRE